MKMKNTKTKHNPSNKLAKQQHVKIQTMKNNSGNSDVRESNVRSETTKKGDGGFTDLSNQVVSTRPQKRLSSVRDETSLFPRRFQWLVFVVLLVIRVRYVSDKMNWWILHPDEIYQSLEVAHSELYGYGFRPYEYLPPPPGDATNVSPALSQEYSLGMYSLRSFLLPRLFIIVGMLADVFGYHTGPFIVWKIFHAVVSSLLPLSVYKFSYVIYHSHDTASLASFLVATSVHLNVLGTHTLLNSFLSPIVFYLLAALMARLLNKKYKYLQQNKFLNTLDNTPFQSEEKNITKQYCADRKDTVISSNNNVINESLNRSIEEHFEELDVSKNNATLYEKSFSNVPPPSSLIFFSDIWRFSLCLLYGGVKSNQKLPGSSEHSTLRSAHHWHNVNDSKSNFKRKEFSLLDFVHGFALALVVYVRLDLLVLLSMFVFIFTGDRLREFRRIIVTLFPFICGFVAGGIFAGFHDYCCYGRWFLSPWQWAKFNVFRDISSIMFGFQYRFMFVRGILFHNYSMTVLFVATCLTFILYLYCRFRKCPDGHDVTECTFPDASTTFRMALVNTFILVFYSMSGHKEIRFMHNFIVVLLIFYSDAMLILFQLLQSLFCQRRMLRTVLYILLAVHTSSQYLVFPNATDGANRSWTYSGMTDSNHVNICFDFISRQSDVTGVFLDRSIHMSGGFTVLHKDVPVLALVHNEFYEFDMKSRVNVTSLPFAMSGRDFVSLSTFNQISDYISLYNTPYLLKVLIEKPEYNYLVLKTDRQFINIGYQETFRSGTMKVLKRSFDTHSEESIRQIAANIPLGSDAAILEYEASWLMSYSVHVLAENKLLLSIRLDPQRVRPYQLLAEVYSRTGNMKKARNIMVMCQKLHGIKTCTKVLPNQILHKEYNLQLPI